MNIGFIGIGIMGSRMAGNLLKAGHSVAVFNRSIEKVSPLLEAGASHWIHLNNPSPKFDVVITMLSDSKAVESVALGDDGFLEHFKGLWIDCSTTTPEFARHIFDFADQHGVRFMDAPVGGSLGQAERAELIFLCGGDAADFAFSAPLFEAMGAKSVHVGDLGMGTSLKLVLNHLLASSMAAFAEALHFGMALGLEKSTLLNILIGGPVVPPYMQMKKEKLAVQSYDAEFPLRLMHKDMQMVSLAAYSVGVPMPVACTVKELFLMAQQAGHGDADFSALAGFLENGR
ncbi:MAG: NAD(P)-dependent oxidoreductase [Calditrichia bacterium]